jgi:hypothetical protein
MQKKSIEWLIQRAKDKHLAIHTSSHRAKILRQAAIAKLSDFSNKEEVARILMEIVSDDSDIIDVRCMALRKLPKREDSRLFLLEKLSDEIFGFHAASAFIEQKDLNSLLVMMSTTNEVTYNNIKDALSVRTDNEILELIGSFEEVAPVKYNTIVQMLEVISRKHLADGSIRP